MAGQVTLDAAFPYARDRLHFPEHYEEGLEPHKVKHILFWGSEDPDTHFDISDTIDLKIAALRCHRARWPILRTGTWQKACETTPVALGETRGSPTPRRSR